jgi:hypothetical protein
VKRRPAGSKPQTPQGLAALLAAVEAEVAALGLDPVAGRQAVRSRLAEYGTTSLECLIAEVQVRRAERRSTT